MVKSWYCGRYEGPVYFVILYITLLCFVIFIECIRCLHITYTPLIYIYVYIYIYIYMCVYMYTCIYISFGILRREGLAFLWEMLNSLRLGHWVNYTLLASLAEILQTQEPASRLRKSIHHAGFFSESRFDALEICDPLKKALIHTKNMVGI